MDVRYLKKLIQMVEQSGISELELEDGGTKIRISKSQPPVAVHQMVSHGGPFPSAPQSAAVPAESAKLPEKKEESKLIEVASPMVGTYYGAPKPGAAPFVKVGDRIQVGQTLCILEAMKIMNELESEVSGVIREVCIKDAQPVEFGQRLFLVEP
jgi:acetyl-CoA carboxylase biotin carboxyl carrier protein